MIVKKRVSELTGFSTPTVQEREGLTQYFEERHRRDAPKQKCVSSIFCVVGAFLVGGMKEGGVPFLILGLIFFWCGVTIIKEKQESKEIVRRIQGGRFQTLRGTVVQVHPCTEARGAEMVLFESGDGQRLKQEFRVRSEGVCLGTPLLLVYVRETGMSGKKEFARVFTSYMLTPDGRTRYV